MKSYDSPQQTAEKNAYIFGKEVDKKPFLIYIIWKL